MIPGGPNARQLPIRPNAGANAVGGGVQRPTAEQMQKILQARQLALATGQAGPNAATTAHIQRLAQARAMQQAVQQAQQQAQLNAAHGSNSNPVADYIPFATQNNGTTAQRNYFLNLGLLFSERASGKSCSE